VRARVHLVAGARPNFMKIGPLFHALRAMDWAEPVLVHTGQHFSPEMSDVFLQQLGLPEPHIHLRARGETHATQTAAVLVAYEEACLQHRPDWVVVAGDVNSTLAACLAAAKLRVPVAHVEAGLRSRDRQMPEEINRVAVDAIADLLWTPSADANENLAKEGVPPDRIEFIGNVMIDAFCQLEPLISAANTTSKLGLTPHAYGLVTFHRPANVDNLESLSVIVAQLEQLQSEVQVVFPVHPRTRARLDQAALWQRLAEAGVTLLPPLGYLEFMSLVRSAALVITDSGGVQEETSYLGVPCLTARTTTERPVTITMGTNQLVSLPQIASRARDVLSRPLSRPSIPLWDGRAAERAATSLRKRIASS
jgi:UDP-N-acetylglucosamine 2-epimerase (non-hydrolysing)